MRTHLIRCFVVGLVSILPVGGVILLVVQLEKALRPALADLPVYFPGMAILAAVVAIYLLGLLATTFLGRWFGRRLDRLLDRAPGLGLLYRTLKQVLGYGSGEEALFRSVVLVRDEGAGTLELGLVTGEVSLDDGRPRLAVFLPGSPNPTAGRMVLLEPKDCLKTQIPVDVALKALLSAGKTGLGSTGAGPGGSPGG